MDMSTVKGIAIGGKAVQQITCGGRVLWQVVEETTGRLPAEYQETAWIGNDAAAGIKAFLDLGFAFDTKARIEMGQYIASDLASCYAFGAAEDSGKLRCMLLSPNAGKAECIAYGSNGTAYISAAGTTLTAGAFNDLEITLESGSLRVYNKTTDATVTNTEQAAYTMTNHLYLMSQNYNGAARFSGVARFSYFRYYDKTDTLICDLVPCYRKVDVVIGMYDLVRKLFLVDSGNSAKGFECGEDVAA